MSFNRQYQLCRSPNDLWMIMMLPHQNGVYAPAFDADSVGIGCIALIRGLDLMRLIQKRETILLCSVAVATFATSAFARPVHHHHHRHAVSAVAQTAAPPQQAGADRDMRYPSNATQEATDPVSYTHLTLPT